MILGDTTIVRTSSGALPRLRLVSVNVGRPRVIGSVRGAPVLSGIAKTSVGDSELFLSEINLDGDDQADRRVHGGPDKAVYAYPSEHLPNWTRELGQYIGPGSFGENLTTAGVVETDVHIGDIWVWGDAILQVCQPRYPCFKLAMILDRPDIIKLFLASARSGWYLRVLQAGRVSLSATIAVSERHPSAVTVHAASRAILSEFTGSEVELEAMANLEPLAESWKEGTRDRLETMRRATSRQPEGTSR